MTSRIGLVIRTKGAPSMKAQKDALLEIGVAEDDIWEDKAGHMTLRDWLLTGKALREGDTLVVAAPHALGETTRKQNANEKRLAGMGVTVEHAETGEGPQRPRGRPPVHTFTDDQKRTLRKYWKQPEKYTRPYVRDLAQEFSGRPVSDGTLKRMFGPRGSK